ncbi:hypothetical protein CCO02nite_07820 [Cellulomonas composti]|uniref:Uncharacterized protein n=2 Tax=Cellulomonas composti TaxID=266130 RepID=A0A511J830_9CELL|nr:hypothetical protein CCO02nite_07820 [Cellulomonas composti]
MAVAATVCGLGLVAGCGGGGEIDTSALDLPFATYEATASGGTTGSLEGPLSLEAGCVLVRLDGVSVVPVLRSGTTWDETTSTISVGTTQIAVRGADITFRGARFTTRPANILVPPSCPRVAEYFVVTGS